MKFFEVKLSAELMLSVFGARIEVVDDPLATVRQSNTTPTMAILRRFYTWNEALRMSDTARMCFQPWQLIAN